MKRGPRAKHYLTEQAITRGLVRSLVRAGSVKTSRAKARLVQRTIDRLLTHAGSDTLTSRRLLAARLGGDKTAVTQLFEARNRSKRISGFTRAIKLGTRLGDSAPMVRIEWVDKVERKNKNQEIKEDQKPVVAK